MHVLHTTSAAQLSSCPRYRSDSIVPQNGQKMGRFSLFLTWCSTVAVWPQSHCTQIKSALTLVSKNAETVGRVRMFMVVHQFKIVWAWKHAHRPQRVVPPVHSGQLADRLDYLCFPSPGTTLILRKMVTDPVDAVLRNAYSATTLCGRSLSELRQSASYSLQWYLHTSKHCLSTITQLLYE